MRGHIRPARTELGRQGKAWDVVIEMGAGPDGKRRQRWVTVRGTKKEAEKEQTRLQREKDTGALADPGTATVKAFLEAWLKDWAPVNLQEQSLQRYTMIVQKHLIPRLGHHRLGKLNTKDIQGYCREAMEKGNRLAGRGLAPNTVRLHVRVLHRALEVAITWGYLARNPADGVEFDKGEDAEIPILSKDQAFTLLQGVQGDNLFMPVVLALGLALRRGEVLALQWKDIDFDAGTVSIRRSMQENGVMKTPKTTNSRRTLALPPFVAAALRMQQDIQTGHKELYGPDYQDGDFVCATPEGRPFKHNWVFTERFDKLLRRLGLPDVTFHSLRHLNATLLLDSGENPKAVSQALGHADVTVTMRVYAHVLKGTQAHLATRINSIFGQ